MPLALFAALLLTAVLTAAAVWDLRTRRIPNALTVPAFAAALALAAPRGWPALGAALAGAALALALGALFVSVGAMGGGDAKLLAVVGAFVGLPELGWALAYTALAGGVFSLLVILHGRVFARTVRSAAGLVAYGATGGRRGERATVEDGPRLTIPYGVPIAVGTLVAVWIHGGPPWHP